MLPLVLCLPVFLVILLAVLSYLGPSVEGAFRHGLLYEFPSGFRGSVVIAYRVPDCPPLPDRDGFFVLAVPTSG